MHIHIHTYIYKHMGTNTYTHTHAHTHTHTHTRNYIKKLNPDVSIVSSLVTMRENTRQKEKICAG